VAHPQVFCALLGKILPMQTQISGDPNNPLTIKRIELVVIELPKNITPVKSALQGAARRGRQCQGFALRSLPRSSGKATAINGEAKEGPMGLAKLLEVNAEANKHGTFAIDTGEGSLVFRADDDNPITSKEPAAAYKAGGRSPPRRSRGRLLLPRKGAEPSQLRQGSRDASDARRIETLHRRAVATGKGVAPRSAGERASSKIEARIRNDATTASNARHRIIALRRSHLQFAPPRADTRAGRVSARAQRSTSLQKGARW
jgi:hypothetical protein